MTGTLYDKLIESWRQELCEHLTSPLVRLTLENVMTERALCWKLIELLDLKVALYLHTRRPSTAGSQGEGK